jgi:SHS2 domain-containing protein
MTWLLLPHTADARAAIDAPNLEAAYRDAVTLVRSMLVGASPVEATVTRQLPPEGEDEAERFFRFVRDLVFLNDAEGFVPAVLLSVEPPCVGGEAFDPARHVIEHGVKALTRHRFRFERTVSGYRAEMVFDL